MSNIRLPMSVCAVAAEVLDGSHQTLDELFKAAGAPGEPPELAHHSKWKVWLFKAGQDPNCDSLAVLGNLIEEFMDLPPRSNPTTAFADDIFGGTPSDPLTIYSERRERLNRVLEENGFRYFRGGRVLPIDAPSPAIGSTFQPSTQMVDLHKPTQVEDLLQIVIQGLPRAMHPLEHRRKGARSLTFESEYDIQDLLHSQLRPWIRDIRPEEFTPSYAGSSTRMDFLLASHRLVIETKRVRDKTHAGRIGDELIVDIEHYRKHTLCDRLWCVVFDPSGFLGNPSALLDLEGARTTPDGTVHVRVFVVGR